MPLDAAMLGQTTRSFTHTVDARWLMAYAAGLGDLNPRYLDTAAGTVIAHPVFPVCLEWPVILTSRELKGYEKVSRAEAARGVHAAHDLHLYRPIQAGDELTTSATIIGLDAIRPGAWQMTRLDTVDARTGALVCRTYQTGISRGVAITGEARSIEVAPEVPSIAALKSPTVTSIAVAAGAANVYTETARIFNPIHSDRAVALAAGLPDIILHGTATLALAVSRLVDQVLGGETGRVRRLGGRFRAMVLMPSILQLHFEVHGSTIHFSLFGADGAPAIDGGFLCYD